MTFGGVIFCYFREARGTASRALKKAHIRNVEYFSSASLADEMDPRPTPRYVFHGATEVQLKILEHVLRENPDGIEVFIEKD